jgi:hypothetical protein
VAKIFHPEMEPPFCTAIQTNKKTVKNVKAKDMAAVSDFSGATNVGTRSTKVAISLTRPTKVA